jgi:predicted Rossmann fold nucleotide-binding protein DprA/Smf involved in DNA uptake
MDLARALRDAGVVVVSGFHSPLERDCFEFLIRGDQGVIWCPARTIDPYRIPKERQKAVDDGRLLLVSPFDSTRRRQTATLARRRNEFVAALADTIIVAYADPGGSLESLAAKALDWGKPVLTFDIPETENLVALGAAPMSMDGIVKLAQEQST